ncbi:MAG: hypothetical protein GY722_11340, partial [bacterium]|nr:hypothetical protein [bacterium]
MRDERLWMLVTDRIEPILEHSRDLFARLEGPLRWDDQFPIPKRFMHDKVKRFASWDRSSHFEQVENPLLKNADFLRKILERGDLHATAYRDGGRLVVDVENHAKAWVLINAGILERGGIAALETAQRVDGVWFQEPGRARFELRLDPAAKLAGLRARNGVTGHDLAAKEIVIHIEKGPAPPIKATPQPLPALELPSGARRSDDRVVFGPGPVHLE